MGKSRTPAMQEADPYWSGYLHGVADMGELTTSKGLHSALSECQAKGTRAMFAATPPEPPPGSPPPQEFNLESGEIAIP